MSKKVKTKPWLRWLGGKGWAEDFFVKFWNENKGDVLIEPFCGGLSISLACQPEKAVANDINHHLINHYKHIKSGTISLFEVKNTKEDYLNYRLQFNNLIDKGKDKSKEAAFLFYVTNRLSFNGLCRFNQKKKHLNTPYGYLNKPTVFSSFQSQKHALENIEFLSTDFEKIKPKDHGEDPVVFIDSPYDGTFDQYSSDRFTWDDQVRVVKWASSLNCPVLMTNKATDRVLLLLEEYGFSTKIVEKKHVAGASSDSRKLTQEVFAWKNAKLPCDYPTDKNWKKIMSNSRKGKK